MGCVAAIEQHCRDWLTCASILNLFLGTNRDEKVVFGRKGVDFKVSRNEMNSIVFRKYSFLPFTGRNILTKGVKPAIRRLVIESAANQQVIFNRFRKRFKSIQATNNQDVLMTIADQLEV